MTIESGTRLGPYEIVSRIGAGGMGVVWQARDTRLERTVAVKVLPPEFSANARLRMRFDREAKVISSLNHPHICTLFDVGDDYLVMELLEGDSLADRIRKGPLPLDQVLRFGMQVAQALDAAHRQGIVHRDLKPANVMLTKSGAKLLDFGLAKGGLFGGSSDGGSLPDATEHKPLTEEGMILGTFQYMAPEQLEGLEADARTDIFALGVLLYEMATGRRAFEGRSRTSLIASIVSSEPAPISSMAPMAPPALDHLVRRCLEKNPDDRWQSAHDVAGELRWISEAGSQAGAATAITVRRKTRERLAWAAAGVALVAALAMAGWAVMRPRHNAPVHSAVLAMEGVRLPLVDDNPGSAVISPDGTRIVYRGTAADDTTSLYLHDLASGTARALPETADSQYAFWSPDSRFVAFFTQADSALKKIDTAGGSPVRIAPAGNGKGGSWNAAGEILFTTDYGSPLSLVSANGGDVREVTRLDLKRHNSHRHPRFLPDGRHFLFLARSVKEGLESSIMLGSLDGGEPREILRSPSSAEYAAGHVFFVRGRTVMAQRFDAGKGRLEGEAYPVAEGAVTFNGACFSTVSASDRLLLFHSGKAGVPRSLEWRDAKSGEAAGTIGEPAEFRAVSLSPSGRAIAATVTTDGEADIWIVDTAGGLARRLPSVGEDLAAALTLDEKAVVYSANLKGRFGVYRRTLDTERVETLLEGEHDFFAIGFIPDGSGLIVQRTERSSTGGKTDLMILPTGSTALKPLLPGGFDAAVSPDLRWVAWQVGAGTTIDLFVASWPSLAGRRQVTSGATTFFWSADSRELFYGDRKNALFAAGMGDAATPPRAVPGAGIAVDMSRDGTRILTLAQPAEPPNSTIHMLQNWSSVAQRRVQ